MTYAIIIWAITQLADAITTIWGIKQGATEANPAMAALMGKIGLKGWVGLKLALSGGICYWLYSLDNTMAILGLSAVVGLVALNNIRVSR